MSRVPYVALFASLAFVVPPAHAQVPADNTRQREQLVDALVRSEEAARSGRLNEAYEILQGAWQKKQTYDLAANLGSIELRLSKFRDAAEHLAFSLREYPPSADDKLREKVQARLTLAKREVGTLWIKVKVERAEVLVDGRSVGLAPLQGELFVEPGVRVVEAKLPGYALTRMETRVEKGGETSVELSLQREASPNSPAARTPPLPSSPGIVSTSPSRALGWTGIAVTGGALIAGTAFALAAKGATKDASNLEDALPMSSCGTGSPSPLCAQLRDALAAHDRYSNWATVSFVAAGVLGVASIAYFAWSPSSVGASYKVTPYATGDGAGTMFFGTFQ